MCEQACRTVSTQLICQISSPHKPGGFSSNRTNNLEWGYYMFFSGVRTPSTCIRSRETFTLVKRSKIYVIAKYGDVGDGAKNCCYCARPDPSARITRLGNNQPIRASYGPLGSLSHAYWAPQGRDKTSQKVTQSSCIMVLAVEFHLGEIFFKKPSDGNFLASNSAPLCFPACPAF